METHWQILFARAGHALYTNSQALSTQGFVFGSAYKDPGDTDQCVAVAREWKQLSNQKLCRESHKQGFMRRLPCKMQSILAVCIQVPMQQSVKHFKLQL